MRHLLPALFVSILFAFPALAQGVATFTYQRGEILIVRVNPPLVANFPWQEGAPPVQETPAVTFAVDIRPGESLYRQEGWMNLSGLQKNSGLLFLFDQPQSAPVGRMDYYQPLDVLWIDMHGVVTMIAENMALNALAEPLTDAKPGKAVLLLAGGVAAAEQIRPGDRVTGSEFFTAVPSVINAQPTPATAP